MKNPNRIRGLVAALAAAAAMTPASAADADTARAKAQAVCAACHGANGISVADAIPNLAGQRQAYLESQLRALKEGTRKHAVMNAIAGQLAADEIPLLAAHFAGLPGTSGPAKSELLPTLAKSQVAFPEGYASSYRKYHVIDFPATRQVRHYWANAEALQAAREGRPLPDGSVLFAEVWSAKLDADKRPLAGTDGHFVPDQLLFYTAMARGPGWGAAVPEMLRNGDWNYAVFTTAKQPRPGVNQAECLACHKPLDKTSYVFTLEPLAKAARMQ